MTTPSHPTHTHVLQNFARLSGTHGTHMAIHHEIGNRLLERLHDTTHTFHNVLNLGGDYALPTSLCQSHGITPHTTLPATTPFEAPLPLDENHFDAVIANLILTWVDDVPSALLHAGKALKKDGFFLASILGAESFHEFRYAFHHAGCAGAHTLNFPDVQAVGDVMQRLKFALPVVDREHITLTYPSFSALYEEIKKTGSRNLNPARAKGLMGKQAWQRMEKIYRDTFALPDGSIPLTLEVIYLTGWRPAPGQPQPLKPGSATMPLAQAINHVNDVKKG